MRTPGLAWSIILSLVIFSLFIGVLYLRSSADEDNSTVEDPENEEAPSSTVMGTFKNAAVVTNGVPCATIARNIFKRGGNAVDAMIAATLCDGIFFPQNNGIGGGFVATYYNKAENKVYSINAREMAPGAATEDMFHGDRDLSQRGGLSIAVPGELKGLWEMYQRFGGGVKWSELFNETISFCRKGIPATEYVAAKARESASQLHKYPLLKEMLTNPKTGELFKKGELMYRHTLANTFEVIQQEGGNALYNGSLTQKFVEDLREAGSIITAEDMAKYTVKIEETPVHISLKDGMTLYSAPLPASGPIVAYILALLNGMLPGTDLPTDFVKMVEAFKFAYGRRSEFGDPDFVDNQEVLKYISDPKHIKEVQNQIVKLETSQDPLYYGANFSSTRDHGTANLVALGPQGDAVVLTTTVNLFFGSYVISPSTGILLNDEMDDFSSPSIINYFGLPPSPANYIRPYKRPLSSMSPLIVLDENRDVRLAIGAAGGSKITTATAEAAMLNLWYNKTIKEALDYRRIHHQLFPMHASYEFGLIRSIVSALKKAGHKLERLTDGSHFGTSATAIAQQGGVITTAYDPRRTGGWDGF